MHRPGKSKLIVSLWLDVTNSIKRTLGITVESVEMLDEIAIIASSLYIALNLGLRRNRRSIFIGIFSLRIL